MKYSIGQAVSLSDGKNYLVISMVEFDNSIYTLLSEINKFKNVLLLKSVEKNGSECLEEVKNTSKDYEKIVKLATEQMQNNKNMFN